MPSVLFFVCTECCPSPRVQQAAPAAEATPTELVTNASHGEQCVVDVWIVSWEIDFDSSLNEDQVIAQADPHDRVLDCELADAIESWLVGAQPASVKHEPGVDWKGDTRMVIRLASPRGGALAAVEFYCDWVRRDRTQYLKFDRRLFELLYPRVSRGAKLELQKAQRYGSCAFGAPQP
jgi:hypothetical protein